jgi:hypothetical protein
MRGDGRSSSARCGVTWWSEHSAASISSSPNRLSVVGGWTGLWGPVSPPMCQVNGFSLVVPPFPPQGPGEPGSSSSSAIRRRYDFPRANLPGGAEKRLAARKVDA